MDQLQILKTEQKALEINLNESIYGTFAEIGAGQEVARNFFQAGAAVGTIAKTMSAYDKNYSDAIYGGEASGRYVCESRVYKMLDHEMELMEERLHHTRPETCFFVFADTVAAINYTKTVKGHGWLGLRFQLSPQGGFNELVLHVKMTDNDNKLQQEAIGVLGVNMVYTSFFYHQDPEKMVRSLIDGIEDRVRVDLMRLKGPDFKEVDNRLLALYLVKYDLSEVVIFDENKNTIHASEFLYKKALMVVRGHFRPPTIVTDDAFEKSFNQFIGESDVDGDKAYMITELTIENLTSDENLDYKDFLDRADLLCAMGQRVIVSNCSNHQKLINYLTDYKIPKLGIVIGAHELLEIINDKYYNNQDGRLLVAFGELFNRNIKIYVYPALVEDSKDVLDSQNLPVPDGIKFLYRHLLDSKQIVGVENYKEDLLGIFPYKVLEAIRANEDGWEDKLPSGLASLVKENGLFGYQPSAQVTE